MERAHCLGFYKKRLNSFEPFPKMIQCNLNKIFILSDQYAKQSLELVFSVDVNFIYILLINDCQCYIFLPRQKSCSAGAIKHFHHGKLLTLMICSGHCKKYSLSSQFTFQYIKYMAHIICVSNLRESAIRHFHHMANS